MTNNDDLPLNSVLAYADSYRSVANQGFESVPLWFVITDIERNIAPLYAALLEEQKRIAAENAALKAAFTPKEIPTGATDVFSDTAILKIDGDEFHSSQWVDNETDVIRAVLDFFKPETPTTDTILASLRAEGVEMAMEAAKPEVAKEFQRETFDQCVTAAVKYPQSDLAGRVEMVAWLELFAAQLRSKSEVQS